jgi:hypothetical protein
MNFLKRLANLFGGRPSSSSGRMLTIYVLSRRCNEPVAGTVDMFNEISQSEDSAYSYYTRKVLHTSGERRCFGQVEVEIWFNQNKEVAHHDVTGGRWLDAEEYAVELARFHAPPEVEDESETAPDTESEGDDSDHA